MCGVARGQGDQRRGRKGTWGRTQRRKPLGWWSARRAQTEGGKETETKRRRYSPHLRRLSRVSSRWGSKLPLSQCVLSKYCHALLINQCVLMRGAGVSWWITAQQWASHRHINDSLWPRCMCWPLSHCHLLLVPARHERAQTDCYTQTDWHLAPCCSNHSVVFYPVNRKENGFHCSSQAQDWIIAIYIWPPY